MFSFFISFILFGQLLAQCSSDLQMKHFPNGCFKIFFFSNDSRVVLIISYLLLSEVFLEKQNDRIFLDSILD